MQQATLLSIQAHYIEVTRDLVNSFLDLFAAFVYGMCIFREKAPFFLFFVDCNELRASCNCIDRVLNRVFRLLFRFLFVECFAALRQYDVHGFLNELGHIVYH